MFEHDIVSGITELFFYYLQLAHDPLAFVKSCESLTFLIRDVAHITPENFECAVQCIRTFVEASLNGGTAAANKPNHGGRPVPQENFRRSKSFHTSDQSTEWNEVQELPTNYHQVKTTTKGVIKSRLGGVNVL